MRKTLLSFGGGVLMLVTSCSTNERQTGYGNERTYSGPVSPPAGTISYPRTEPPLNPSYPTGPVMTQADLALANAVRDQFNRYGDLASAAQNIQVTARNGAVTLTGNVSGQRDRQLIDTVTRNTPGVVSVNDRLQLSAASTAPLGGTYGQSDQALANQLQQALSSHPTLGGFASNIRITVQNGRVALSGSVPSEQDRQMVDDIVRNTAGVVSVSDQLQIATVPTGRIDQTSRVYPADSGGEGLNLHVQGLTETDRVLAQRILDAVQADPDVTGPLQSVNINVSNGKVSLDGTVPSLQQKRSIIAAIQRAAGVNAVYERLQVIPN
jgi:osmotically-inducible protein OsmY